MGPIRNVHEIIFRYVESNLTGFQNLSGLVVEVISCTFLTYPSFDLRIAKLLRILNPLYSHLITIDVLAFKVKRLKEILFLAKIVFLM